MSEISKPTFIFRKDVIRRHKTEHICSIGARYFEKMELRSSPVVKSLVAAVLLKTNDGQKICMRTKAKEKEF